MKHFLSLTLIYLAAMPLSFAQTSPAVGNATAAEEVKKMVEQYATALKSKDTVALEKIWADNYIFVNGHGGFATKAERLANLKSGATNLEVIAEEGNQTVFVYGDDSAVVTGRFTLKGHYSKKATSGQFASGMLWVKTPSGWQLAFNQITPVTSP